MQNIIASLHFGPKKNGRRNEVDEKTGLINYKKGDPVKGENIPYESSGSYFADFMGNLVVGLGVEGALALARQFDKRTIEEITFSINQRSVPEKERVGRYLQDNLEADLRRDKHQTLLDLGYQEGMQVIDLSGDNLMLNNEAK